MDTPGSAATSKQELVGLSSDSMDMGTATVQPMSRLALFRKPYTWNACKRRKPLEASLEQNVLPKVLGLIDLCTYGVAATVGSGIFVVAGSVAHDWAGPAIVFSILIAGVASLITGFCYLEFAGQIPTSGSAYVYTYTVLGELMGWFIGWNLTLEYSFSAAAIAGAWTGYLVALFKNFNVIVPTGLYAIPTGSAYFIINPMAAIIVLLLILIILSGIKFTSWFNNFITLLNIGVILLIIIAGAFYVDTSNWKPFVPLPANGIFQGASIMFFSFIGFDTVCTLTAEAKKPKYIYFAVIVTLSLATVLYTCVSLILTGMVNYRSIDKAAPLSMAFFMHHCAWAGHVVGFCSVTAMTATMLACMVGQPRIFYSMALDGLIPPVFTKIIGSSLPIAGLILTGIITGLLAFFVNVEALTEMISLGILLTFAVVASGLLVLRFRQSPRRTVTGPLSVLSVGILSFIPWLCLRFQVLWPVTLTMAILFIGVPMGILMYLFYTVKPEMASKSAGFRCPLVPILPSLSIICNTYLMTQSTWQSYVTFLIWSALGFVFYFLYGIRHSALATLTSLPVDSHFDKDCNQMITNSGSSRFSTIIDDLDRELKSDLLKETAQQPLLLSTNDELTLNVEEDATTKEEATDDLTDVMQPADVDDELFRVSSVDQHLSRRFTTKKDVNQDAIRSWQGQLQ